MQGNTIFGWSKSQLQYKAILLLQQSFNHKQETLVVHLIRSLQLVGKPYQSWCIYVAWFWALSLPVYSVSEHELHCKGKRRSLTISLPYVCSGLHASINCIMTECIFPSHHMYSHGQRHTCLFHKSQQYSPTATQQAIQLIHNISSVVERTY